jgi:hypothetical protein
MLGESGHLVAEVRGALAQVAEVHSAQGAAQSSVLDTRWQLSEVRLMHGTVARTVAGTVPGAAGTWWQRGASAQVVSLMVVSLIRRCATVGWGSCCRVAGQGEALCEPVVGHMMWCICIACAVECCAREVQCA